MTLDALLAVWEERAKYYENLVAHDKYNVEADSLAFTYREAISELSAFAETGIAPAVWPAGFGREDV